jgi:hypothetical protein
MLTSNPKITGSVQTILGDIPVKDPTKFTIHGTVTLPEWTGLNYHFQGVAPRNGNGAEPVCNGCISASSSTGYFAAFSQYDASNGTVNSVAYPEFPSTGYYHAAGIQMLGDLLPVPFESKSGNGVVEFYDLTDPSNPQYLYTLGMPGNKASAVGITTYTDGSGNEQALLVVYEYDHRQMYVFQTLAGGLSGPNNPFGPYTLYTGDALKGDQYQCFALVTQSDGDGDQVFLLGFREDEELHLFTVTTATGSSFGNLTKVQTYKGWNGSDWRNGVGLQIADSTSMRIFGTDKDPKGTHTDYTFKIYVWGDQTA